MDEIDDADKTPSKVEKLLPKSVAKSLSKRRRKHKRSTVGTDQDSLDSTDRRRLSTRLSLRRQGTNSSSLLGVDAFDDDVDDQDSNDEAGSARSIATSEEPEIDASQPHLSSRPNSLTPHPSQIGHLSITSPEVRATHVDSITNLPNPELSTSTSRKPPSTLHAGTISSESQIELPGPVSKPTHPSMSDKNSLRLKTPSANDKPGPLIVNTPPTPTDSLRAGTAPSTPEKDSSLSSHSRSPSIPSNSPGGFGWGLNAHKRSRSGPGSVGPSKLSNNVTAPLTPTPELSESNIAATPTGGAGFFTSMLSAAQNAANTLSNIQQSPAIGAFGGSKNRSTATKPSSVSAVAESTYAESEVTTLSNPSTEHVDKKAAAISTLGSGDLSLSHLGFTDPPDHSTLAKNMHIPDPSEARARSESAPAADSPVQVSDLGTESISSRPQSLDEPISRERTPPPDSLNRLNGQRTPSLASAIKPHRKRGSSVTTAGTAGTIGAAIAAVNHSVANPTVGSGGPKLTGFAIASKKRNRDFHSLFKSVPDDDYLIEDYSCALQREILAHGRLYVSEGHLCFSSNILGWTTTLVMSFDEIVSVEKRSTALVFKNGLEISTLHAKHVFASFTSRDATYDLIVNIWKLGHPTLKSTQNGVRVDGTGGDKTEKVDSDGEADGHDESDQDDDAESSDDEEFYDEEAYDDVPDTQITTFSGTDAENEKGNRKVSSMTTTTVLAGDGAKDGQVAAAAGAADFPGPAAHAPTECGDASTHYEKVIGDEVIPAPLGKVYNLVFGPGSPAWMGKWLTGDQKCFDLQMEDKKGLTLDDKTRTFTYIKPLNASIGPKQTKCIVSETVEALDLEKAVSLSISTQNPDVPSGNVFVVKTKYCLTWAENNSTHMLVNCTTEWTGKSWLKGPIEKGVNDGQTQYCKDLFAALKAEVTSRSRANTATNGTMRARKRGKKSKAAQPVAEDGAQGTRPKKTEEHKWGPLEPIRPLLEPAVDLIKPLLTGNIMYGLLVGLLVATWFRVGFPTGRSPAAYGDGHGGGWGRPDRVAAYEEMWRREDTELWEWLEERVGLERLNTDKPVERERSMQASSPPRNAAQKLKEQRMEERKIKEAIKVTEEKLRLLKEVVDRKEWGAAAEEEQGEGAEAKGSVDDGSNKAANV